jgi:N6-adenosine-specific RNA methylase IME4
MELNLRTNYKQLLLNKNLGFKMSQKFQVIVADCPWSFKDSLKMSDVARGASSNYGTMTISDIQQLPIKDLISPDGSILALWVPSSLLQEGLDTMKTWGFAHKQTYVWVKTKNDALKNLRNLFIDVFKIQDAFKAQVSASKFIKSMKTAIKSITNIDKLNETLAFGMGRLFRQTHEICLIGTSNNKIYSSLANKSQRSVSLAPNLKHSAKPENLQDSLDIMFPVARKIELFARRVRPGWICLGNEIDGKDIRDALADL